MELKTEAVSSFQSFKQLMKSFLRVCVVRLILTCTVSKIIPLIPSFAIDACTFDAFLCNQYLKCPGRRSRLYYKHLSFFEISSLALKLKFTPKIQHQIAHAFLCNLCNYVICIISRLCVPS